MKMTVRNASKATVKDRDSLEMVRLAISNLQRTTQDFIDKNKITDARPSQWQSVFTLENTFHIPHGRIRRLIELRFLESRPSDGFGPEVRVADPEARELEGDRYYEFEQVKTRATQQVIDLENEMLATTCFHCGAPALPETHGMDPRCARHFDV